MHFIFKSIQNNAFSLPTINKRQQEVKVVVEL